jgi:hypothetical protein
MRISRRIGTAKATILFALILVLAMPLVSFAQGRGRGRGRGLDNLDKCGKFVNCHDARDGRWDGRGPRGSRVGRRIRHDDDYYSGRRIRRNRVRVDRDGDGDFDHFDVLLGRRNRVDRDGDGDFDRFDVLLGRRQNRIRRNSRLYR